MTPAAITAAAISAEWLLDQAAHQAAMWMGPALTHTFGPVIFVAMMFSPLAMLGGVLFFALGESNDN